MMESVFAFLSFERSVENERCSVAILMAEINTAMIKNVGSFCHTDREVFR
jgi:hypothetical protein